MSLDNQAMEKCLLRTPLSTDSTCDDTAGSRFSSLWAYLHQLYPHSTFLPFQKPSERPVNQILQGQEEGEHYHCLHRLSSCPHSLCQGAARVGMLLGERGARTPGCQQDKAVSSPARVQPRSDRTWSTSNINTYQTQHFCNLSLTAPPLHRLPSSNTKLRSHPSIKFFFLHGPAFCSMHLISALNQHSVHFPNPTHSFMQIFSNPRSAAMEQLFSLLPEGAEHMGNTCCLSGYSLLDPRIRLAPVPLGIYILPGYCLGEDF